MYICNMLDKAGVFRTSKDIHLVLDDTEFTKEGFLTLKGNEIVYGNASDENIFLKGLQGEDEETYLKIGKSVLKYKHIKDTDENPLIIVLCNKISLYDGIPCGLKLVNLGAGAILACLIYGACDFDGVPMQRANTSNLDGKEKIDYYSKDLEKLLVQLFTDKESEYCYLDDVVVQVELNIKKSKVNGDSFSCRVIKSGTYFLNEQKLLDHREKARLAREAKERKRLEALEAKKARSAELAEKEKEERFRKMQNELEKKSPVRKTQKKDNTESVTVNVGAQNFLRIVGELK